MAPQSRLQQAIAYRRTARMGPPDLPYDAVARLRPGIFDQFRALSPGDQHHMLQVYRYLVLAAADDITVTAGLLHDIGKACRSCNITIAHRAAHVLLNRIAPGPYRRIIGADHGPGWAKELRLLAHHPARGAEAARQAGYEPDIVHLIAVHEAGGNPNDPRLALLRQADANAGPEHDR